jgi:ABC-type amino acid transport substrate-binding protein
VVRNEASERDLISAGVPDSALVHASSNAELLKMSERDMIDAMVDTEVGMAWNLRTAGLKPSAFARAMRLSDEGAYYFAMNSDSDPALVHNLQVAIATLVGG